MNKKTAILSTHISKSYQKWLDYCRFHCSKNGLNGEEEDVLMKVIEDLWQKDHSKLHSMLLEVRKKGTALDFYVLRMIYIYVKMPLAPYRWNYKKNHIIFAQEPYRNNQAESDDLESADYEYAEMKLESVIRSLSITALQKRVLLFRLVSCKDFDKWRGKVKRSVAESEYRKAFKVLKNEILKSKPWI